MISSSSLTTRKPATLSSSSSAFAVLNLVEMTPFFPRPVGLNSSVDTRFPYPCSVTIRTNSSLSISSALRIFIAAIVSPGFRFMDLTPLLFLPVGRNSEAPNRVALPKEEPIKMSSSSVHLLAQSSRSPSINEAITRPRAVIFSNTFKGVLLIIPCFVAITKYSSSVNLVTASMAVTDSPILVLRIEGMGVPFALRLAVGTW
mmetsp:Transcript_4556/g.9495  ORF Transcript_4556/g.9495 Transcript_4556/m.9495 type:complete len:202 (-) Transcript_4556:1131-1736(-)